MITSTKDEPKYRIRSLVTNEELVVADEGIGDCAADDLTIPMLCSIAPPSDLQDAVDVQNVSGYAAVNVLVEFLLLFHKGREQLSNNDANKLIDLWNKLDQYDKWVCFLWYLITSIFMTSHNLMRASTASYTFISLQATDPLHGAHDST